MPRRAEPFLPNRDWDRRDEIVGVQEGDEVGGSTLFRELDAAGLGTLLGEGFIDPYATYNLSPSVWEFFRFLCGHPGVTAMGYAIDIARDDYSTHIVTVSSPTVTPRLRRDARTFCKGAEERSMGDHLECFWD